MTTGPETFTPDDLARSLAGLPRPSGYLVAFSGGCDSTALLAALAYCQPDAPLRAVHVNHGRHARADEWAEHCRRVCSEIGVSFQVLAVAAGDPATRGGEGEARAGRYDLLSRALTDDEMLLTAHHRDDQAETVLLQLMRGAGVAGLSAMAACREFGPGWIARPLLDVPRAALRDWLAGQGRDWLEDPDNANEERRRNFLRHRVLPLLETRWPGARPALARAAANLGDADAALAEWARRELAGARTAEGSGLRIEALRAMIPAAARQVILRWLVDRGLPAPSRDQLDELHAQVLGGADDRSPCVSWPGCEARAHDGVLYAMVPLEPVPADLELDWRCRDPLTLPAGLGELVLEGDGDPGWNFVVRLRRGGEKIRLPGRDGRTTVKQLMQELRVPPWERDRVPLVFRDGQLEAVADWVASAGFSEELHDRGLRLRWLAA